MFFFLGPIAILAFFGALEILSRTFGLSLSIFGAFGAVLRQTDEPRLQRRQALVMLLLVAGIITFGFDHRRGPAAHHRRLYRHPHVASDRPECGEAHARAARAEGSDEEVTTPEFRRRSRATSLVS
jgi:hypothetical protein